MLSIHVFTFKSNPTYMIRQLDVTKGQTD